MLLYHARFAVTIAYSNVRCNVYTRIKFANLSFVQNECLNQGTDYSATENSPTYSNATARHWLKCKTSGISWHVKHALLEPAYTLQMQHKLCNRYFFKPFIFNTHYEEIFLSRSIVNTFDIWNSSHNSVTHRVGVHDNDNNIKVIPQRTNQRHQDAPTSTRVDYS